MLRMLLTSGLCVLFGLTTVRADEQVADIDQQATHRQSRTIEIQQGASDSMKVNAFCLSAQGEILAAVGQGPGEIRVFDDQGKLLRSWKLSVKPEAINTGVDGTILAGGEGKLFHFSADGTVLKEVAAPHAESLRKSTSALREEAIAFLERVRDANSGTGLKARVTVYEGIIAQLEKKAETTELNAQETQLLKLLPATLDVWKQQLATQEALENGTAAGTKKQAGPSEQAIATQVEAMMKSKMRIASISTDGESIYVATPDLKGYGFAVWKLNSSMTDGTEIVKGLSGCCGQMDVQACAKGIFVAENSRKRVVCYDSDGNMVRHWGKSDRTGLDGFTSCCNPMNVCFNKSGDVFTAESNTGRIKRFSADGEFLNFVGDVKLVPGCKNVSIAVTPDHSRVYMLDLTRNHIVVMDQKPKDSTKDDVSAAVSARGQ